MGGDLVSGVVLYFFFMQLVGTTPDVPLFQGEFL